MTTVDGNYIEDEEHLMILKIEGKYGLRLKVMHYRDEHYNLTLEQGHCNPLESVSENRKDAIELIQKQAEEGIRLIKKFEEEYAPIKIKGNIVDYWLIKDNGEEESRELIVPWSVQQKGSLFTREHIENTLEEIKTVGGFTDYGFTQTF